MRRARIKRDGRETRGVLSPPPLFPGNSVKLFFIARCLPTHVSKWFIEFDSEWSSRNYTMARWTGIRARNGVRPPLNGFASSTSGRSKNTVSDRGGRFTPRATPGRVARLAWTANARLISIRWRGRICILWRKIPSRTGFGPRSRGRRKRVAGVRTTRNVGIHVVTDGKYINLIIRLIDRH